MFQPKEDVSICKKCDKQKVCKYTTNMERVEKKIDVLRREDTSIADILIIGFHCNEYKTADQSTIRGR